MKMNKIIGLTAALLLLVAGPLSAADYIVDAKGMHASINFRIKHLGYSWLTGRFEKFGGSFSFDENNIEATKIAVDIDVSSVDSNHAERDKHLRSDEILDVSKYPDAKFVSTGIKQVSEGEAILTGDLTLHGVTRAIEMQVKSVGGGDDPWGGYRQGFEGKTSIALKDFGIDINLGPASTVVEFDLYIEGVRQ